MTIDNYQMVLGFMGAMLVLIGYVQVSRGAWKARSHIFQLANAIGALLLIIYSISLHAYPNVLLNGVWLVTAIAAIYKLSAR